jgi:Major Facilitator Superfamily
VAIAHKSNPLGLRDPLNRAIAALGVTQIIAWGTTLYALGVLGKPIVNDTGWSPALVYGGLTAALLVSGIVSISAGRWLDHYGGRAVMTLGSLLTALSLALVAQTTSVWAYLAAWGLVGFAMRLSLYDAGFAALVQMAPARGRRAISLLTLPGGLASTILWPVGAGLEHLYGWRATLLIFAAMNLALCAPLHWFGLARSGVANIPTDGGRAPLTQQVTDAPATAPLEGTRRTWAMLLFSLVMSASAIVMGAMAVHLVPILAATGLDPRYAVLLASVKGVAQTVARLIELVFGKSLHAVTLARLTFALLPLSFAVLLAGGAGFITAAVFVVLFGAANGLTTIVRGAVPLVLFGPKGYGEVLGKLATPILLMNAIAPMAFALLTDGAGPATGIIVLAAASLLAVVAMEIMAHWMRRTA